MNSRQKNRKNVLFVVDERRMGGVSVLLEDMMNMIDLSKYNIDILSLHNNGEMLEKLPKGVNLIFGTPYFSAVDFTYQEVIKKHDLSLLFKKIKIVFDMKTNNIEKRIVKERKKILNKKYDVEIAFKDGFTALFTGFGDSKKKVHWLHYEYKKTNPNEKYDNLFRSVFKNFDDIFAVSNGVMDAFNDLYHLEEKTHVILNLVDTNKIIEKSKEKCEVKLNDKELNFISVGRLHPMKGYDRLINVIHRLKEEKKLPSNFKLRIYGTGNMLTELNEMINNFQLGDYIKLMGQVMNPYKYLKKSDMFILCSIYEPFGLVMVEAMTTGVPVLATANAATSRIIDNKKNGYIVENSENGLYEGLGYLFLHLKEIEKYKENLKKYEYDNTKIIKQIEEVLDK